MIELMQKGGGIIWIILACFLVSLVMFIERWLYLHRARIKSEDFLKGIINILSRGNATEAVTICEETPGPVPYLVKTAILHRKESKAALRDAVDEAGRSEIAGMERRLVAIATIGQTMPLLGLLGTIVAMVRGLKAMQAQAPLVQSGDITGWLMQALVLTAAGLAVAIPCYAGYNFLVTRIQKIVLDMERAAADILTYLTGDSALVQPNHKSDGAGQ